MKKADLTDAKDIYRKKKVANKKFNYHLKKITINYQANFIHKDADDALDRVVNF